MHIQGAVGIKTIIQIAEVGIGLTVATFIFSEILKLFDLGIFDYFQPVLQNLAYLFGSRHIQIFTAILCGILIVMGGRWIMSWASNNGGQTPNNRGN